MQLELLIPQPENGYIKEEGAIMVEVAKCLPDHDACDWKNKIVVKLGYPDIGQLIVGARQSQPVKLFHKTEKGSSTIQLEPRQNGSYRFSIMKTTVDGVKSDFGMFLKTPEMLIFITLLEHAIPKIAGW